MNGNLNLSKKKRGRPKKTTKTFEVANKSTEVKSPEVLPGDTLPADKYLEVEKPEKKHLKERVAKILHQFTKGTVGVFEGKGFRQYDYSLGTWLLLDYEKMEKMVCDAIASNPSLRNEEKLASRKAWQSFLGWYEVAYRRPVPEESPHLLGFKNGMLDKRTMCLLPHAKAACCFQAVQANFVAGPPNALTMGFLIHLASGDPVKLNLLRAYLKAVISKVDLHVIPYLYGDPGTGKSTFLELLKKLSYGNSADMDLQTWSTQFGKSSALGADIVLFDDIDYHGLSYKGACDMKKFVTGGEMMVDRKMMSFAKLLGGFIFITGNRPFSYVHAPELPNDEGWRRRVIYQRVQKTPGAKFNPRLDMIDQLEAHTGQLVGWAQALSEDCVSSIRRAAPFISTYLERDNALGDLDYACGTFFCENIRLANDESVLGGHGRESKPGTLQCLFVNYLDREEIPIPKGRFDLKESILRTLVQLGLAGKVQSKRGRNGWEYIGITISPSLGSAIEREIPAEVKLLSEYPVDTWMFENNQLMSFNGEVIDDPLAFSAQQGGNKAFTSQAQELVI